MIYGILDEALGTFGLSRLAGSAVNATRTSSSLVTQARPGNSGAASFRIVFLLQGAHAPLNLSARLGCKDNRILFANWLMNHVGHREPTCVARSR